MSGGQYLFHGYNAVDTLAKKVTSSYIQGIRSMSGASLFHICNGNNLTVNISLLFIIGSLGALSVLHRVLYVL